MKDCPPGFVRNDRFLCRKDKTKKLKTKRTKKPISKSSNTSHPKTKSLKQMFNEDTVFVFYSKSASAKPGMGKNETIPEEKKAMYEELNAIPQWRQKLSNFWMQPFKVDGLHWASVEHYYQGSKFKAHPDFYYQFSIESNSEISKSAVLAKSSGGKDVKHKYRPKEIKVDEDFFSGRAQKEMYKAQRAKFNQHKDLQTMLKATKEANLMHYTRGGKLEQFMGLMQIRSQL